MLSGLTLPFSFDVERLKTDLQRVLAEDWAPHYNEQEYGGQWRGSALRSATGNATDLHAGGKSYVATPLLERCGYFREVLEHFRCPQLSVRLLSLLPGSYIREHTDNALGYEHGEVRLHIPIQTSPDVEFYLSGERLLLEEGRTYYLNVNLPHRVNNRGTTERIHLVIDASVNDWLRELFERAKQDGSGIARSPLPARGFVDFASRVLNEPRVQDRLADLEDKNAFVDAAVKLGLDEGFEFCAGDVHAAMQPGSPGGAAIPPAKWVPVRMTEPGIAEWLHFGNHRWTEPFFEDSVRLRRRRPFAAAFRVRAPLDAADSVEEALAPSGFLFHVSRCGSTLLTQMIAALPDSVVISEAELIDQVVQAGWAGGVSFEDQVKWLRRAVKMFGRRRTGREKHLVVKLDAWHVHARELIRAAFPETPFAFVFRDPVAVVASQMRSPGVHCLPGALPEPRALQLEPEDITRLSRAEWCVEVIARVFQSGLALREDPSCLCVDYADLPEAAWTRVLPHFGMAVTQTELEDLQARSRFHGKTGAVWSGDPADRVRDEAKILCGDRFGAVYNLLRSSCSRTPVDGFERGLAEGDSARS